MHPCQEGQETCYVHGQCWSKGKNAKYMPKAKPETVLIKFPRLAGFSKRQMSDVQFIRPQAVPVQGPLTNYLLLANTELIGQNDLNVV